MKFPFNRALALLVTFSASLIIVTSCSKSNNNSSSTSISATVSGSAWANNFPVQGVYSTAGSVFLVGGIQVKSGDSTSLEVGFGSPVTLNKALTSDGVIVDVAYINAKTQSIYDGSPVSTNGHSIVTVTSYDSTGHKVGGTFSGVLYNEQNANDSVIVTNGNFSSTYTTQ